MHAHYLCTRQEETEKKPHLPNLLFSILLFIDILCACTAFFFCLSVGFLLLFSCCASRLNICLGGGQTSAAVVEGNSIAGWCHQHTQTGKHHSCAALSYWWGKILRSAEGICSKREWRKEETHRVASVLGFHLFSTTFTSCLKNTLLRNKNTRGREGKGGC